MAEFNLDNIATDLNNKIGKSECVRYPVSKWQSSDGKTWYVVYNDGWIEQGGKYTLADQNAFLTITLPLPFKDTNYTAILTAGGGAVGTANTLGDHNLIVTGVQTVQTRGYNNPKNIYCCGY